MEAKDDGNDDSEMLDINESKLENFVEDKQKQYSLEHEIKKAVNVNIFICTYKPMFFI